MRFPSSSDYDGQPDHGFQIAPIANIVFVVLLFFVAFSGLRQVERHIAVGPPTEQTRDAITCRMLVIDIAPDGTVYFNGANLGKAGLRHERLSSLLQAIAKMDPLDCIVLRAAPDAQHGDFIHVLAGLQRAGLKNVALL